MEGLRWGRKLNKLQTSFFIPDNFKFNMTSPIVLYLCPICKVTKCFEIIFFGGGGGTCYNIGNKKP